MKRLGVIFICAIAALFYLQHNTVEQPKSDAAIYPQPIDTEVKWDMEDGTKPNRHEAIDKMHRTAEGVDWRNIEFQNSKALAKQKNHLKALSTKDPGVPETIVDDYLSGAWYERGSRNQSGSVLVTDYVSATDKIYTISAGGNLWEGNLDGSEWKPINEDLRFFDKFLFVNLYQGNYRMIAAVNGQPSYSDDNGATWTTSDGIPITSSGFNIRHSTRVERLDGSIEFFFLMKKGYWEDVKLYRSIDHGESYHELKSFTSNDMSNFAVSNPIGTQDIYLIEQISDSQSHLYLFDHYTLEMETVNSNSPLSFGSNGRGNLQSALVNDELLFYAYNEIDELYVTKDLGVTWEYLSTLPIRPWEVGMYLSPSDPDVMLIGGVNAYRSLDGGLSWQLINEWWEYYNNVEYKLHADMMYFNEFTNQDGQPFMLISNHGGLNVSYDKTLTNQSIALSGLNVSQYYSVATSPLDPTFYFAGSQDQGFQRGKITNPLEAADLVQVISGDYGHIIFTENGSKLFTVYPGGWVTYYAQPFNESFGLTSTYEIISPNESVWIPPMMPHPDANQNIAYIAGGNVDSLDGRHIIEMIPSGNSISATALPFDFTVSGGNISAMETNHFDHDHWYVATDNGKFYRSEDGGMSFTEKAFNLPGGHYLYGSDIMASKLDEDVLYISGSGYSNAPVLKSTDNGDTWTSMSVGLPSTLAFGLATNPDESLIFAATEAGPFVYITDLNEWFPLSGTTAPYTTYWSVEFVDDLNMARFGTYGRGAWDFEVMGTVSTSEAQEDIALTVYPNPASDLLTVSLPEAGAYHIDIHTLDGKRLITKDIDFNADGDQVSLDISQLPIATYVLSVSLENKKSTSKIFIKAE